MNVYAQPPTAEDVAYQADAYAWPLPWPVVAHAVHTPALLSPAGLASRHTLCRRINDIAPDACAQKAPESSDPMSAQATSHHDAALRTRQGTAGFHSRLQAGFACSHFFPRSVGFGPADSHASGAFINAPSILCQDHAMPPIPSYSAKPFRQSLANTPMRFHSKKYWWIELEDPKYAAGTAFHWHPVRNTYTMPARTRRGASGFRPPPGFRAYLWPFLRFCLGMRGAAFSHNASDISMNCGCLVIGNLYQITHV